MKLKKKAIIAVLLAITKAYSLAQVSSQNDSHSASTHKQPSVQLEDMHQNQIINHETPFKQNEDLYSIQSLSPKQTMMRSQFKSTRSNDYHRDKLSKRSSTVPGMALKYLGCYIQGTPSILNTSILTTGFDYIKLIFNDRYYDWDALYYCQQQATTANSYYFGLGTGNTCFYGPQTSTINAYGGTTSEENCSNPCAPSNWQSFSDDRRAFLIGPNCGVIIHIL